MSTLRQPTSAVDPTGFLAGGGEMGALIRGLDWSATPLGPPHEWPQSLRTAVSILLNSRYPMFVFWGSHLVKIYNDGYRPITGARHPWCLGRPGPEVWPEIWDTIGPMVDRVIRDGEATWSDDLMLCMHRNGYPEEVYFTFSYSPIREESGGVGGMFCACTETTDRVLGERRLNTLRDLAAAPAQARTVADACGHSAEVLADNPSDVPFALIYLLDGGTARLQAAAGVRPGSHPIAPATVRDGDADNASWPLFPVAHSRTRRLVENLGSRFAAVPQGPWPEAPTSAMVLPIFDRAQEKTGGLLVLGVSARRAFDDDYKGFFELVAGQIAGSIGNARASEEERRRTEALAELDRAKTLFFSNVSHEFRTPLTLMLGPLEEALSDDPAALPQHRTELARAHRNALRLLRLVNTLLDFSRVESGRIEASYEPVELASLTVELASNFRSACERAGVGFLVRSEPLSQPVWVDRDMWEKIVLNLVSNAFKFTLAGEIEVDVRPSSDGACAELIVRDTGTGIPEEELSRIFERFHRVRGQQGRTHEGTGIGLALVQELVRLHGGSIQVESREGVGSTFIVRIPFGHEHLPSERLGATRSLVSTATGAHAFVEEALRWLPGADETDIRLAGAFRAEAALGESSARRAGSERPLVLVADDNTDMRDYVRRLLLGHYDVAAAANGEDALALARGNRRPDLILTDVMMPGRLDGFGLLKEVRADAGLRDVPVIILSARAGEEARIEGLAATADDYLAKPFSARELTARVTTHLEMARLRREAAEQERSLRAQAESAEARVREILETITDGFYCLDPQWCFTYVNAAAERFLRRSRLELLHRVIWDLYPEAIGGALELEFRRAVTANTAVAFEVWYAALAGWFEIRAYPAPDGSLNVFFRDVTEKKRADEALLESNQALRQSNEDLERFAYAASHDLQEPLRMVTTYTQLLERKYKERLDSEAEQYIRFAVEGAARMKQLIQALLAYGRVSNVTEPWVGSVDAAPVLRQALANLDQRIRETGAIITSDVLPSVAVPDVQLLQLFQNLIGNAIKYVQSGIVPRVHISAVGDGDLWRFSVADNGIGIAPRHHESIFAVFTRLHGREVPGTGIGLAVCRRIVERAGGRIWVESQPGRGSTFCFTLPATAEAPASGALASRASQE